MSWGLPAVEVQILPGAPSPRAIVAPSKPAGAGVCLSSSSRRVRFPSGAPTHQDRLTVGRVALTHEMEVRILPLVPIAFNPTLPNGKAAVRKTAMSAFDSRGRVQHFLLE